MTPGQPPGASAPAEQSVRSPFERRAVLSAAVDLASPARIVEFLTACAERHEGRSVVGISAPYASAMVRDEKLRAAFLNSDVLVPDGKGFEWGARMLGVPCGERIAIPDLCERLLEAGNARSWKVFLYGSTAELNARALENLRERFPQLAAVEGAQGYDQGEAEENALLEKLRAERFNLLIVARPSPDKELFLARACRSAGVVGLAAGGYADILAGEKKRAPGFVQAAGMEWSWRMIQDPRKLWKRIGWANLKFAAAVLWNKFLGAPRRPFFALPALHVAAILALIALAYGRSLNAPYHFDDPEYIMRNTAIRSFDTLNEITVTAHRKLWWLSYAICYKISELYGDHQPMKPDVRVFRLWNVGCHFIAALALYGLLRRALRASNASRESRDDADDSSLDMRPFAAAAIFAAHPLCTEAVTYISGRDNGMGGMFYLLGLYFAAIAFERMGFGIRCSPSPLCSGERAGARGSSDPLTYSIESKRAESPAAMLWPRWFWPAVLMILMGACAVLTKESHLTFPAAVGLLYICFFRRGTSPSVSAGTLLGMIGAVAALGWGASGRSDGRIWIALPWAIFILAAGVFASSAKIGGYFSNARARFFGRKISAGWALLFVAAGLGLTAMLAFPYSYSRTLDALTGQQGSSYVRSLCSQAYAVPRMLLRAIFPLQITFQPAFNIAHNLNIDHQFPTLSDPGDPRVLWNAAVLFALAAFGVVGAWRGWLASFGVLLAFIVIAPTNTVIERGDIVSERNFYLVAAAGACVLAWIAGGAANLLFKSSVTGAPSQTGSDAVVWRNAARREAALWTVLLACCAAGPFVSFTILRNVEWMEPLRLWESAMSRSPDKMRVLYNYGVSAQGAKKYEEAEAAFNRAIQLGEQMSLRGQFRPDEAVDVKCFHYAYARLADLHLQRYINSNKEDLKALAEIKDIYEKGLNRTASDPDLAFSYANFLINCGQAASTVQMLKKSHELHTWADQLYLPLGVGTLESGDYAGAIPWLEKALSQKDEHALGFQHAMPDSDRARILFILGIARSRLKNPVEATAAFREALRLDPQQFLPLMTGLNAVRNLKLRQNNTTDMLLQALSMVWRDMLIQLRAAAADLSATKAPTKIINLDNYNELFDTEIKRRDANQKRRLDAGFSDDPEKDE